MPYQLSVVHAGEFVRCGTHGSIHLDESRRILLSLAGALVARGVDKAILDLRQSTIDPPLTYTQLYELAGAFHQAGFGPRHRLALIVPPDRYSKAHFFTICASDGGWNCLPFCTFEESLEWLAETTELSAEGEERAPGGQWHSAAGRGDGIDTRLVAAVQARAGARVHEAAGLLNEYRLTRELLRRANDRGDENARAEHRRQLRQTEYRLRQFLSSDLTAPYWPGAADRQAGRAAPPPGGGQPPAPQADP
jgi:hypothetical protein